MSTLPKPTAPLLLTLGLAAASVGCLSKDVTHTLTLENDGAVTWTIVEANVRSTEEDIEKRGQEEADYLAQAMGGELVAHRAMADLGVRDVRTTVLRDRAPLRVEVEGRFDTVDDLIDAWRRAGMPGEISWRRTEEGPRFELVVSKDAADAGPDDETPTGALMKDIDRLRIVPASGSFDDATGFDEEDEAMALRLDESTEAEPAEDGTQEWAFTWTRRMPSK